MGSPNMVSGQGGCHLEEPAAVLVNAKVKNKRRLTNPFLKLFQTRNKEKGQNLSHLLHSDEIDFPIHRRHTICEEDASKQIEDTFPRLRKTSSIEVDQRRPSLAELQAEDSERRPSLTMYQSEDSLHPDVREIQKYVEKLKFGVL